MIYHHPLPLPSQALSGSMVRICRMIQAFQNIGYTTHVVAGYANDRRKAVKKVKELAREGQKFDFLYSESSTAPSLHAKNNILKPFLEIDFFNWCRGNGIPAGVYYRDIYWRFELFKTITSWRRRAVAVPLYWYDWLQFVIWIDHLFLPSLEMAAFLPPAGRKNWIHALPPGCDIKEMNYRLDKASGNLSLLYVGGVKPPLYDLTPLFEAINRSKNVSLTICCRINEWRDVSDAYKNIPYEKVEIVHKDSDQLSPYYFLADAFILAREQHPYLSFAMPVKIFESIGYGLPLISMTGTRAADFISQENIGWVVANIDELVNLLEYMVIHPEVVMEKKRNIERTRPKHTWEERAKQVANILTGPNLG